MTIKSLDAFLSERLNTLPLDILRDSRLGIDAHHYIARALDLHREPLSEAIGGFPVALKQTLINDIALFKSYQIKPVFVFPGHSVSDESNATRIFDISRVTDSFRQRAWTQYETDSAQKTSKFPLISGGSFHYNLVGFNYEHILPELIDILFQHDVEYLIAPYLSWAQLVYLYQEDLIDAIYGPNELLLSTSLEKFIFSIDTLNQEFKYADRIRFLQELNISQQQLLDLSITVGCDLQPYTLPLLASVPQARIFQIGIDMLLRQGMSIYSMLVQAQDELSIDRFQRGVVASRFIPVMKTDGRVGCFNYDEKKENAIDNQPPPSDVHDVIGQRLPHEYYFYESMGLIQTHVLEDIVSGKHVVRHPLDGGNEHYKSLVASVVPFFKNKEYNLLTQQMARFYQVKQMVYARYFDRKESKLENRLSIPIFSKISKIVVRSTTEKEFSLKKFVDSLQSSDLVSEPPSKTASEPGKLQSNYDIIATALLRELYLIGFFKFENSAIVANEWTPALFALSSISEENLSLSLLLLITLKLKAFDLTHYITSIRPFSKSQEVLVRLASFIQISQSQSHYKGPINKKILSFRSALDLIKTHTRDLFECVLVSELAKNEVSRIHKTNQEWRGLVSQIPFKETTPSTVFAQIMESLLIEFNTGASASDSKAAIFKFFKDGSSGSVSDPQKDFNRFVQLFDETCSKILPVLENGKLISDELIVSFKEAKDIVSSLN
ncbi:hypothetical protein WICPIJ_005035 [Wickerhamomyces pijperi]|uniref:XPG N-terminal domain-containing protein n=1 Tax=Wickerhamomyces pijperi TaxID=599730 RepID=A0A9P8Q6K0_WICPI|nr:hypothetical protein WICPIJ_005035 [Wickerhamomyces pijperi]